MRILSVDGFLAVGLAMSFLRTAILGLFICFCTCTANAQGVNSITSEFEVSESSSLYAAAMGLDPADMDGQSRLRVAWHKAPVPGGGFEYQAEAISPLEFQKGVFVSTFSLTGVSLQDPVRADDPEIAGWPQDPILAADELGRFVVVWRQAQLDDRGSLKYSLWMRPFDPDGTPLGEAQRLTHETLVLPSIDMAATGEFVIVLGRTEPENEDNFDKEPARFWRFGADFQPVDEEPLEVDTTLGRIPYSPLSAVALNESGEFAIAYVDSALQSDTRTRRLRLRTFSREGSPLSQPVVIESTFVWGLQLRWLDSDHFVAAWMEGGRYSPISGNWQVFTKDGQATGQQLSTDVARGQGGVFRLSETEFAITWATESAAVLILSTAQEPSKEIPLAISKKVSWKSYTDYYYGLYDAASPLSAISLDDGQFAAIFMNTLDGQEMVRAQVLGIATTEETAIFESEVFGPCVAQRTATVQLKWSSDAEHAEISVAGPPAEKLFARVGGSGEISTGLWARHGMVFLLYDQDSGEILATTKARPNADTCPMSPIVIDPEHIEVCDPREYSTADVLWDLTGSATDGGEIRVNGIDGKLFARGGKIGNATTGQWLRNGMHFYLLEPYSSELLGTATVQYRQKACP
jgi:hypothetical protein